MTGTPKQTDVETRTYLHNLDYSKVKALIIDADLECGAVELPEGLVALDGDVLVGYIGYHIKYKGNAHIDMLVVDKDYRRSGVGTLLIRDAAYQMKTVGVSQFSSEVELDNQNGIVLYSKLGAVLTPKLSMTEDVNRVHLAASHLVLEHSSLKTS